jgi:PHD/YefM family antitoxin component YafN of YafNO toxin-antitoxin module
MEGAPDLNPIPLAEQTKAPETLPLSEDSVIDFLKNATDMQSAEVVGMLQRYEDQCRAKAAEGGPYVNEPHLEGKRAVAHALTLAEHYYEAVSVMETILEIAQQEGNTEAVSEAEFILGKIKARQKTTQSLHIIEESSVTSNYDTNKIALDNPFVLQEITDFLRATKNLEDPLVVDILRMYGAIFEIEARHKEGMNEKQAKLERLRKITEILYMTGHSDKSIQLIQQQAEIVGREGDTESYDELQKMLEKIQERIHSAGIFSQEQLEQRQSFKEIEFSDADQRSNFEKTMQDVNAGNHDPQYLEEVLDWLSQDADNAEKDVDNPERAKLRHDIAEAIIKIRNLIRESK